MRTRGRYEYPNGDVYNGTFVNAKREGLGEIVYKSGNTYQG